MSSKTDSKPDSKADSFVKLAIFLFVTLLSFSIGIFAGKKFSDNQHALSALEPQKAGHATREVASTHEDGAKPGAMTDEEIAKLAEEFVADETTPVNTEHGAAAKDGHDDHAANEGHGAPAAAASAHAAAAPAAPAHGTVATKNPAVAASAHAPAQAGNHEPSKVAQNVAAGKAPTTAPAAVNPAKSENRVPSALPKEVGDFNVGKFTVQVAAYAEEGEAQRMASDLKTKGYSAYYIPTKVDGKTWFRVSVGQFSTQKEAQAYRTQFMQKAKVEAAFVQKITQ